MSLLPGPEPPDGKIKHLRPLVNKLSQDIHFDQVLVRCYIFTWAFVITCSHSSKGGVAIFAWERSGCRYFISWGLLLVSLTAKMSENQRGSGLVERTEMLHE